MTGPLYRFDLSGKSWDNDPYYVASGRSAHLISVVAATKQEAINAADTALGSAGNGRHWRFTTLKITDTRLLPTNSEAAPADPGTPAPAGSTKGTP